MRQIAHFYVIRTLGTGGMGVVYEAQVTRLPRSMAVKVLKDGLSKNVDAVRRFKREARLASSLDRPNICAILEVGDDQSQSQIAMELLEGRSLKSRLPGGPVWLDEIADIASQVADALDFFALGAVHEKRLEQMRLIV
jgi:serine/threonine protein kinase